MKSQLAGLASSLALSLAACALPPTHAPGLMDVADHPAEKALQAGMRAHDDAQFPQAEQQLALALECVLVSPCEQAAAHKHLAVIYCTSTRLSACEAEFRAARAADLAFTLSKPEAGHPVWGPMYQRVQQ